MIAQGKAYEVAQKKKQDEFKAQNNGQEHWQVAGGYDSGGGTLAGKLGEEAVCWFLRNYIREHYGLCADCLQPDYVAKDVALKSYDPDIDGRILRADFPVLHVKTSGTGRTTGGGAISLAYGKGKMDDLFRLGTHLYFPKSLWSSVPLSYTFTGEDAVEGFQQGVYQYISFTTRRWDVIAFCSCARSEVESGAPIYIHGFLPFWWLAKNRLFQPQVNDMRKNKAGVYWDNVLEARWHNPSSYLFLPRGGGQSVILQVPFDFVDRNLPGTV